MSTWKATAEVEQIAQIEPIIAHQIRSGILKTPEHSDEAERTIRLLARVMKDPEFKPVGHDVRPVHPNARRVLVLTAHGTFAPMTTEFCVKVTSKDLPVDYGFPTQATEKFAHNPPDPAPAAPVEEVPLGQHEGQVTRHKLTAKERAEMVAERDAAEEEADRLDAETREEEENEFAKLDREDAEKAKKAKKGK